MVFVNFRRIFLTLLFITGAVTLLLGYSGVAGIFLKETAGVQREMNGVYRPGSGVVEIGEKIGHQAGQEDYGKEGFFVECRLQRERARSQQIELLKDIVNSPSTAGDTRQVAQDQLLGISKSVAKEARLENLIKARGYHDAVVSMDQKSVTVVVDGRNFNHSEEARIIELVSKETGFGEQGIIIIPKS